jgi:CHAT domain-containing protein/tetratricopeptide (TPR) repeat protein
MLPAMATLAADDRGSADDRGAEIADRFIAVLVQDDLRRLGENVAPEEPVREWADLREVIDWYDCIQVRRADWSVTSSTADEVTLEFDLDLVGEAKASWRPAKQLSRRWTVVGRRAKSGWRIARASTGERRVIRAMTAAPTTQEAEQIFINAVDVDRAALLQKYVAEPAVLGSFERLASALALAKMLGELPAEIAARARHGAALPDRQRAMEEAQEAVALATQHGTADDHISAYLFRGWIEVTSGKRREAAASYAAGAALIEQCENPVRALQSLAMQAWVEAELGLELQTLATNERLAALSARYGWTEGEENAMLSRGDVHFRLGSGIARDEYQKVIRLGRARRSTRLVAYAEYSLGYFEMKEGNFREAIPLFRDARAHHSDDGTLVVSVALRIAEASLRTREYEVAKEELRNAEALTGLPASGPLNDSQLWILLLRSDLLRQTGNVEEAVALARDGVLRYAPLQDQETPTMQIAAAVTLGRALRAASRTDDAIVELRRAVALIEETSTRAVDASARAVPIQSNADAYVELVELLVERNAVEEAFRISEEMRARGLREMTSSARIQLSSLLSSDERSREEELERRIVALNRALWSSTAKASDATKADLAVARRELDAFRAEMRLQYPRLRQRRLDVPEAVVLPESSMAVLEYLVGEKQTIVFSVRATPTGAAAIEAHRLPIGRRELERDVAEITQLLASRSPGYRAAAQQLYESFVAPVEPLFRGAKKLCIVPDGPLWTIPFHALAVNGSTYLGDRHSVFFAHSLTLLRHASPAADEPARLIAFGNPSIGSSARSKVRSAYRDVSLGSLVDAEKEVRALEEMYSAKRMRAYYGREADEEAFKKEAPSYEIIHVAAHAIVDHGAPMYSAIVLAAGGEGAGQDGLLEAREVADLPLNGQLAVLSACETARGKIGAGEGVIGLSWAFFAAGCPTTVVSQWNAESRATAKLMTEFHRRLLAGQASADALRDAQLAVRQIAKYSHPFYWAPFVVIGSGQRGIAAHRVQ